MDRNDPRRVVAIAETIVIQARRRAARAAAAEAAGEEEEETVASSAVGGGVALEVRTAVRPEVIAAPYTGARVHHGVRRALCACFVLVVILAGILMR